VFFQTMAVAIRVLSVTALVLAGSLFPKVAPAEWTPTRNSGVQRKHTGCVLLTHLLSVAEAVTTTTISQDDGQQPPDFLILAARASSA
jgi:hypothetical protein